MSTIGTILDVRDTASEDSPGAQLTIAREKKGYSQEYVAGKLHLRVKVIELLELDNYQQMPEAVFIKGYLRAYANLLGIPSEPLLQAFKRIPRPEKRSDKTLWQSKKESHRNERLIRYLTGAVALSIFIMVGIWWQKSKNHLPAALEVVQTKDEKKKPSDDVKLTDLSKMQQFSTPSEKKNLTLLEQYRD